MLKGDSMALPTEDEWTYMPLDTIGEVLITIAYDLAPKTLEERKQFKDWYFKNYIGVEKLRTI